jgi:hypothetical protein
MDSPSIMGGVISKPGSNESVQKANQDLADAFKTLSHPAMMGSHRPNVENLLQSLHTLDLQTMPLSEVEELARMCFEGSPHIEKNPSKAVELWTIAADRGSLEAKYSRALCMKDGIGIDKDGKKAAEELSFLSKEKDYHLAHYSLALMYDQGVDIPQNYEEAFMLFKKAALEGITPALHNIGNCYAAGKGVQQNDQRALLYYQAADEAGDHIASFTLGTWYYSGRGGLKSNKEKAFELQLKAAQRGHPGAMFNVGTALLVGEGTEKDIDSAVKWLQYAADAGIVPARLNLAKVFIEGEGPLQRLDDAAKLLEPIKDKNEIAQGLFNEIEDLWRNK